MDKSPKSSFKKKKQFQAFDCYSLNT